MANLVLNGKSIDTLDDIAENFVETDVLREFQSGSLAAWLEEYGYEDELARVQEIKPTASNIRILAGIIDSLNLADEVIARSNARREEQQRKDEDARKAREEQQRQDDEIQQHKKCETQQQTESNDCKENVEHKSVVDMTVREGLPDIDKVTDWRNAYLHYTAAAKAGNAYALGCLAVCNYHCYGYVKYGFFKIVNDCVVKKNRILSWAKKSAEQGNSIGRRMLGMCFRDGIGVESNPQEGVKWFRLAAEQGDLEAQYSLALCYKRGIGIKQDRKTALKLYNDAAMHGFPYAQLEIGLCYFNGNGVVKDHEKAVEWFRKAAEQGVASAQLKLGRCYRAGFGVPKDLEVGKEWSRKATQQGCKNTSFIDEGQTYKAYRVKCDFCGIWASDGPDCRICADQCPNGAITIKAPRTVALDRDTSTKCLSCYNCSFACPTGVFSASWSHGYKIDPSKCINCGSCMSLCTKTPICSDNRCVIDSDKCSRCGICVVACPNDCIIVDKKKSS